MSVTATVNPLSTVNPGRLPEVPPISSHTAEERAADEVIQKYEDPVLLEFPGMEDAAVLMNGRVYFRAPSAAQCSERKNRGRCGRWFGAWTCRVDNSNNHHKSKEMPQ